MWWGRGRRRERSQSGSLLERLKVLEASMVFASPAVATDRVASGTVGNARPARLIGWFGLGFACACVGGGITLMAMLLVHPAQAEQSFGACSRVEPVIKSGSRKDGGCGGAPANEDPVDRLEVVGKMLGGHEPLIRVQAMPQGWAYSGCPESHEA